MAIEAQALMVLTAPKRNHMQGCNFPGTTKILLLA